MKDRTFSHELSCHTVTQQLYKLIKYHKYYELLDKGMVIGFQKLCTDKNKKRFPEMDFDCCYTPVLYTKVKEVGSECWFSVILNTDARKECLRNECMQSQTRATRKVVLTDVRNRLLGNICMQGMGQIP